MICLLTDLERARLGPPIPYTTSVPPDDDFDDDDEEEDVDEPVISRLRRLQAS
jgi:hypothetical protein